MRRIVLIVLVALISAAQDKIPRIGDLYPSPDEVIKVQVVPTGEAGRVDSESRIEVRSKYGKLLANKDFSSEDHEHGYGVVQAQWTPDSQFFVVCLANSGGHSPMQTPVFFYSRKLHKFLSLDDFLGKSVGFGEFKIESPNKLIVTLDSGRKWKGSLSKTASRNQRTK